MAESGLWLLTGLCWNYLTCQFLLFFVVFSSISLLAHTCYHSHTDVVDGLHYTSTTYAQLGSTAGALDQMAGEHWCQQTKRIR